MIKMAQRTSPSDQGRANGANDPYLGSAPDYSMVFDVKDVVDVAVANVSTTEVIAKEATGMLTAF